jgi:phage-related protein
VDDHNHAGRRKGLILLGQDRHSKARRNIQTIIWFRVKDVEFVGSSDDDLRDFPLVARQRAGYQLHLVQNGQNPSDWKPMAQTARSDIDLGKQRYKQMRELIQARETP